VVKNFRTIRILICFVILVSGFETAGAQDAGVLPPSGRWVTDQGGFFSQAEERRLDTMLRNYSDTTSTQIIVVTVQNLGGMDAAEYSVALGRRWEVGQEGKDNGLIILLSRDEREVYIATGYGIEGAVPDALAGRIVRNVMIPRFREGQFFDGVVDAISVMIAAASGEFDADSFQREERQQRGIPSGVVLIIIILIVRVVSGIRHRRGGGGGGTRYRNDSLLPIILWSALGAGHRGGGGFGGGGFGGGGFGGGGGSFGGGGAGGSW
jgi:uncharacterized protein